MPEFALDRLQPVALKKMRPGRIGGEILKTNVDISQPVWKLLQTLPKLRSLSGSWKMFSALAAMTKELSTLPKD